MSPKKKSKKSGKKGTGLTKRNKENYRALRPELNLKSRYEEIEDLASYAHTLPPEAKEWLNAFAEEEICANFKHKGVKLNKTVTEKRRIYNKNNARNRCVFTKQKAQGKENMDYLEVMKRLEKDVLNNKNYLVDESFDDDLVESPFELLDSLDSSD